MHRFAQHRDILRRVGADQNGLALLLVGQQVFADFFNTVLVKTVEWLDEYQYLRILHYRLSKPQPLPHTDIVLMNVSAKAVENRSQMFCYTNFRLFQNLKAITPAEISSITIAAPIAKAMLIPPVSSIPCHSTNSFDAPKDSVSM